MPVSKVKVSQEQVEERSDWVIDQDGNIREDHKEFQENAESDGEIIDSDADSNYQLQIEEDDHDIIGAENGIFEGIDENEDGKYEVNLNRPLCIQ